MGIRYLGLWGRHAGSPSRQALGTVGGVLEFPIILFSAGNSNAG